MYNNQYTWWDVNKMYAEELIGDAYIFEKAENRIDEEEDKKNRKFDEIQDDKMNLEKLKERYEVMTQGYNVRCIRCTKRSNVSKSEDFFRFGKWYVN